MRAAVDATVRVKTRLDLTCLDGREKRLVDLVAGRIGNLIGSMASGSEQGRVRACDLRIKNGDVF